MMLEKTLRSPLDCKEIKPVNLKEINSEYSLEGLMLKLKFQYFGNWMWRADSLEKILMLGKIERKRRRGQQKMRWLDSITDSMDIYLSKLWDLPIEKSVWANTYGWYCYVLCKCSFNFIVYGSFFNIDSVSSILFIFSFFGLAMRLVYSVSWPGTEHKW